MADWTVAARARAGVRETPGLSDPRTIACLLLSLVCLLGGIKTSLMLEQESPIETAAVRLWVGERGIRAIERSISDMDAADTIVLSLLMLGVGVHAESQGGSATLAQFETLVPIAERIAIDSGSTVHPAGREAVHACFTLRLVPWWVFVLAALPLLAFGGSASSPAQRPRKPLLWATAGIAIAFGIRMAAIHSLGV